eukprot:12790366-Alexandrium_andersonii.AAC.1
MRGVMLRQSSEGSVEVRAPHRLLHVPLHVMDSYAQWCPHIHNWAYMCTPLERMRARSGVYTCMCLWRARMCCMGTVGAHAYLHGHAASRTAIAPSVLASVHVRVH